MGCCGPEDDDTFVSPIVKYLMFFFNFFFWLVGGGLIGIGVWAYIEKERLGQSGSAEIESIYDLIFDVTIIVIILGIIIFILAFLGCLGSLRENVTLLKIFFILLIILFVLEVTGAVLAFVFSRDVKSKLTSVLKDEAVIRYRDDLDLQNIIDWIQKNFQCCGVGAESYKVWNLNPYFNCTDSNPSPEACGVPYSCCVKPTDIDKDLINTMCGYGVMKPDGGTSGVSGKIFEIGCIDAFLAIAEDNLYIIGGVVVGIAVVQILAIFFARILAGQVQDQLSRWR
ncbi:tetraspanin-33 isoform X1 [Lingula anatina]|uniref:Tetraspanin n=1 Tax=Lingula anatina TaxID=7574 RepID=A0A1S3HUS2_LINAN|nr:tetraspanin-33 isoform X1 [Lingula anatina]|eukprot:XP_013418984.1 tetraspanin-33 isoform X1 [Lingula anatina]